MSGTWLIFLSYIVWGILAAYWTLFKNIDPLFVLANRIIWSLAFCYLILQLKKETHTIKAVLKDKRQMWLLLAAGLVVTVNWGSFIIAVMSGHILDASLAYYMSPIFSIVLGFFVYREKLRPLQWLAFALAVIGVAVPVARYGQIPVYAIVIGVSFAVYGAIKKKVVVSGIMSIFMETLLVLPLALVYVALYGKHAGTLDWQWWIIPTTGIITSVPLIMFAKGVKTTSLSMAGILMYINPTMHFLLGVFFYHEPFTLAHAWMFAFVWAGVVLFIVDNLRARHMAGVPVK